MSHVEFPSINSRPSNAFSRQRDLPARPRLIGAGNFNADQQLEEEAAETEFPLAGPFV